MGPLGPGAFPHGTELNPQQHVPESAMPECEPECEPELCVTAGWSWRCWEGHAGVPCREGLLWWACGCFRWRGRDVETWGLTVTEPSVATSGCLPGQLTLVTDLLCLSPACSLSWTRTAPLSCPVSGCTEPEASGWCRAFLKVPWPWALCPAAGF